MNLLTIIMGLIFATMAHGVDLESLLQKELFAGGSPTREPSASPTVKPTNTPTARPTTSAPTRKPSAVPTAKPTAINVVDFSGSNTIEGLSAAAYAAAKNLLEPTFKAALAVALNVETDNVVNIDVTDIDQGSTGFRRALAGSSSVMKYRVIVHDDTKSFTSLRNALLAAFTPVAGTTPFATALAAAAVATSTTSLVSSVTVSEPLAVTNNLEPRGVSSKLTGTQIAGLVIGIVLCVGLIALLAFFIIAQKGVFAAANAAQSSPADNQA